MTGKDDDTGLVYRYYRKGKLYMTWQIDFFKFKDRILEIIAVLFECPI